MSVPLIILKEKVSASFTKVGRLYLHSTLKSTILRCLCVNSLCLISFRELGSEHYECHYILLFTFTTFPPSLMIRPRQCKPTEDEM